MFKSAVYSVCLDSNTNCLLHQKWQNTRTSVKFTMTVILAGTGDKHKSTQFNSITDTEFYQTKITLNTEIGKCQDCKSIQKTDCCNSLIEFTDTLNDITYT